MKRIYVLMICVLFLITACQNNDIIPVGEDKIILEKNDETFENKTKVKDEEFLEYTIVEEEYNVNDYNISYLKLISINNKNSYNHINENIENIVNSYKKDITTNSEGSLNFEVKFKSKDILSFIIEGTIKKGNSVDYIYLPLSFNVRTGDLIELTIVQKKELQSKYEEKTKNKLGEDFMFYFSEKGIIISCYDEKYNIIDFYIEYEKLDNFILKE